MGTLIRKGTSKASNGTQVSDLELVRYVGFDTYCRLRKNSPDLYAEYIECWKSTHPCRLELHFLEVTPEQIKSELVEAVAGVSFSERADALRLPPGSKPLQFDDPPLSTAFWVVWLFIIVIAIVAYLVSTGLVYRALGYRGPTLPAIYYQLPSW